MQKNIKPQFKGNVGLFLTCAELSKNNLIVLPTFRNTKGYDLLVLNPETNKSIGLQVKCSDRKEFPVFSSYKRDYKQKMNEKILCDFIFVDISNLNKPRYFILSKEELKKVLISFFKKLIKNHQRKHHLTFTELKKDMEKQKKPELWVIKLGDIEKYENNWDVIFKKID